MDTDKLQTQTAIETTVHYFDNSTGFQCPNAYNTSFYTRPISSDPLSCTTATVCPETDH